MTTMKLVRSVCVAGLALAVAGCGESEPVSEARYQPVDALVATLEANIDASPRLQPIVTIDHSRLGAEAGSVMPPAEVVIFSERELETALIGLNPLVALDLPLRVLAFESIDDGSAKIISNSFDYLVARHGLDPETTAAQRKRHDAIIAEATAGIADGARARFANDAPADKAIITIDSPYDYEETIARVNAAIDAQDDTLHFGVVDFRVRAAEMGVELAPAHLILFGGPGPGGKAMSGAPTLGLDGFCQKFLIWQDADGAVKLSFNDLLALAERQDVSGGLPLQVINFRLNKVFGDALAPAADQ